ncbi:LEAF RUST 10 DISEASE-RESISTANCE LOCUS RECEPTOR-LIKE PROTEIN KINASE-like 2.5 [Capsella rubella]|uniref:LEAF RUST 10 DISEASE-RESISTANCE LOCUS RECEPTOR-LIKE PROTEIN KINASE-like 2.5 n=1 Tax=Capsella rubella TaxID=81985 RepID=UPI000CD5BDA6|nr:LEAF RUST 10 DISEASE-RESISTANCE LOCUS RECEPTOR-LIKE PROTEIN KINASE-like 2.5 [Capsella rubella]
MSISLLFIITFVVFSVANLPSCFSADQQYEECRLPLTCGSRQQVFESNTTYPFWGSNKPRSCGTSPFELSCENNQSLTLDIGDLKLRVRSVNLTDQVITVVDESLLDGNCSQILNFTGEKEFTISTSTAKIDLFECRENVSSLSNISCLTSNDRQKTYHVFGQSYTHVNSCVKVGEIPMLQAAKNDLYLSNDSNGALDRALEQGFDLKYNIQTQVCEDCTTSGGICGSGSGNFQCLCEDKPHKSSCHDNQANNSEIHKRCSGPFSCSNQKELFYPFWIAGREDCGHPDFKLDDCSAGFPEFSLSSVKFRILEADYITGIIRLARLDYTEDICPDHPIDAPFNGSILPFANNTKLLTIYSQCTKDLSALVSSNVKELACGDDNGDEIRYYVTRDLSFSPLDPISTLLNEFERYCDRNVSIPVSGPTLNTLQLTWSRDNLKKAFEDGFQLGPNQECPKCIESGGACGYNQSSSSFTCYYMEEQHKGLSPGALAGIVVVSISGLAILTLACLGCACLVCSIRQRRKKSNNPRKKILDDSRQQYLKALIPLKHYNYVQIKKITKSFAEVVGKGGFGTVYKGILCDGRIVAVKILKDSQGNGEDFINEVASMSKTSHVNIVNLLGFCSEGSKRAIIYEFMENGSLDKFISSKKSSIMDWGELYRIALGVARGLEYLHHGCRTRIVHFDIKPQNVLLDDNLCPKVSDFGLAKLCEKKESILSLLDTRGTIGYIAPELFSRMYGRVSHKSDVYSYGMLVLEMIGAKNKPPSEDSASNQSSIYFPEWIYKDLENQDNGRLLENDINSGEEELVKKMTLVGLWCIQSSPSDRPSMDRVVEMMEGNLNALEVPPRPVFQIPVAPLQESSTISEDVSAYTEICSVNIT